MTNKTIRTQRTSKPALPVKASDLFLTRQGTDTEDAVALAGDIALYASGAIPLLRAAKLPKWRAALAKQRVGTYRPRIVCVGDSTTFGDYSNGTSTGNFKPLAWPTLLTALLNAAGTPAQCNSIVGDGSPTYNLQPRK